MGVRPVCCVLGWVAGSSIVQPPHADGGCWDSALGPNLAGVCVAHFSFSVLHGAAAVLHQVCCTTSRCCAGWGGGAGTFKVFQSNIGNNNCLACLW